MRVRNFGPFAGAGLAALFLAALAFGAESENPRPAAASPARAPVAATPTVSPAAPGTPSGTPVAAGTPTPTPCTGKFSCVPLTDPIEITAGVWVRAGQARSLVFELIDSYGGGPVKIPVTVIRGARPGPTLLLTSTIHGDEMIGLPILLALRERIPPDKLAGIVVMLPVVNPHGFERQTRYLPDRRDLNRYFPGNPRGSIANRIAHRIFQTFALPADYCLDFHTAAGGRANAAHVRADPASAQARTLAQGFGGMVVLQAAQAHTLRHAATVAGVPTAVFEGGEAGRLDPKAIEIGIRGVENLLASLGMLSSAQPRDAKPLWMSYAPWVRADSGGIIELAVALGDLVQANQLLLTIVDTFDGKRTEVRATAPGIVMSLARSPVAEPGYALLRLGVIQAEVGEAAEGEAEEEVPE